MRTILSTEGVSAGCALLDESLDVVWANDCFVDLLPPEAPRPILGHHVREVSPLMKALGLIDRLQRVAMSGEPFDVNTVTPARKGVLAEHWKRSGYRLPTGHVLFMVQRIRVPAG